MLGRWLALSTVAGVAALGLAVWWRRVVGPGLAAFGGPAPVRPADALLTVVAGAAFVLGCWLVLGLGLDLLARVPGAVGRFGETLAARVTPRLARQVVAATLGLSATTVLLPPVSVADPGLSTTGIVVAGPAVSGPGAHTSGLGAPGWSGASSTVPSAAPSTEPSAAPSTEPSTGPATEPPAQPGWVAEPPAVRPQPDPQALTGPGWAPTGAGEVVVRRGDTLWDLTARHLGPDATAAEVAQEWPRWYAANRDVIGPDPDRLLPGQVLRVPERVGSMS